MTPRTTQRRRAGHRREAGQSVGDGVTFLRGRADRNGARAEQPRPSDGRPGESSYTSATHGAATRRGQAVAAGVRNVEQCRGLDVASALPGVGVCSFMVRIRSTSATVSSGFLMTVGSLVSASRRISPGAFTRPRTAFGRRTRCRTVGPHCFAHPGGMPSALRRAQAA